MTLTELRGVDVSARSRVVADGVECALAETPDGPRLTVLSRRELPELEGERNEHDGATLVVGPLSERNASAMRRLLPWLRPQRLGLRASIGLGDRLGLATPGHIRALRATGAPLAPVFAQQSIRELDRTGRTSQEVMDAALWGAFAEGWHEPFGADADHLKTTADIDRCLDAGCTLFTIDPSDHVRTEDAPVADWPRDLAGRAVELADRTLTLTAQDVQRAAAKYGAAVEHVTTMYEHLVARAPHGAAELEVSVDETPTPTTHAQHAYLALELRRRGVRWVSLAPRFVGTFEKGIDYVGDLDAFAADFAGHAAIAAALGPYKLSLHSGSDKLSLYPLMRGIPVHVKTSGTSYLEALRTIARHDPELFQRVYARALERFAEDRATYDVSADVSRLPPPTAPASAELLDDDDARRVLHVTFGSVLGGALGPELTGRLTEIREAYAADLEAHFVRHLRPFS